MFRLDGLHVKSLWNDVFNVASIYIPVGEDTTLYGFLRLVFQLGSLCQCFRVDMSSRKRFRCQPIIAGQPNHSQFCRYVAVFPPD